MVQIIHFFTHTELYQVCIRFNGKHYLNPEHLVAKQNIIQ